MFNFCLEHTNCIIQDCERHIKIILETEMKKKREWLSFYVREVRRYPCEASIKQKKIASLLPNRSPTTPPSK